MTFSTDRTYADALAEDVWEGARVTLYELVNVDGVRHVTKPMRKHGSPDRHVIVSTVTDGDWLVTWRRTRTFVRRVTATARPAVKPVTFPQVTPVLPPRLRTSHESFVTPPRSYASPEWRTKP